MVGIHANASQLEVGFDEKIVVDFFPSELQGSLNYLFGGYQTMQMYGKFDGFPINSALFGAVI